MKKNFYISVLAVLMGLLAQTGFAQDQQYTQFYANPMYLSSAFAGTSIQSRAVLVYRNQWPSLPQSFVSYGFSFDHFVPEWNSGIGISVNQDKAGTGGLSYTSATLNYAYEIKLTRKFSLRPALSVGFGSTYLDINKLTFTDQLARESEGTTTLDPDRARFEQEPVNYADFGSGILLYSSKIWFGASLQHMNEPVQSVTGGDTELPMKLSVHGGMRIKVNDGGAFTKRQYIVPAFNYMSQGMFDQLDIGFYYEYDPIILGLWYRGLPGFKSNDYNYLNQDAVALLVGYQLNNMKVGYSYDLTISSLTPNSAGAHEISMSIEFASRRSKKANKRRVIPCAKF